MKNDKRIEYLRLEKGQQELWESIKKCIPDIKKMLKNSPTTVKEINIMKVIIYYLLTKNELEKIDKKILEEEIK